jgi:hypothetical protein
MQVIDQKGGQVKIHQLVNLEINCMLVGEFRMFLFAKIILI